MFISIKLSFQFVITFLDLIAENVWYAALCFKKLVFLSCKLTLWSDNVGLYSGIDANYSMFPMFSVEIIATLQTLGFGSSLHLVLTLLNAVRDHYHRMRNAFCFKTLSYFASTANNSLISLAGTITNLVSFNFAKFILVSKSYTSKLRMNPETIILGHFSTKLRKRFRRILKLNFNTPSHPLRFMKYYQMFGPSFFLFTVLKCFRGQGTDSNIWKLIISSLSQ